MLNHIVLMGRLTRDPELRRTGSGVAVASFTLAVDRDFASQGGEKETDFVDIVAWRSTAEFVSKYFAKGRMIIVDGRLEMRDWTDKEGNKRTSAEIVVNNAYFGDNKRDDASNSGSYSNSYSSAPSGNYGGGYSAPANSGNYGGGYSAPASAPASDFAMLEDDDAQLPF